MNTSVSVSVVVVSFGRADVLLDAIDDLLAQHYEHFDITVVDQNPAVDERLLAKARSSAGRLKIFRLDPPHMCVARNVGIRETRGDIVTFVDDDIRCEPHLIRSYVSSFSDDQIGGVGGWIDADVPEFIWHPPAGPVRAAIGCNMAFRRDVLEQVGGFDTNLQLPATYGDEIELAARVKRAGYTIISEPAARVFHRVASKGGLRSREQPNYWQALTSNQVLVFLQSRPLWQRMLVVIWLVKLWLNLSRLSTGLLKVGPFLTAVRLGFSLAKRSRATRSFLTSTPPGIPV